MWPHCSFRKWRRVFSFSRVKLEPSELLRPPIQHHGQRQSSSRAQSSELCREHCCHLCHISAPLLFSSCFQNKVSWLLMFLCSLRTVQFPCTAACSQLNSPVGSGMLQTNTSCFFSPAREELHQGRMCSHTVHTEHVWTRFNEDICWRKVQSAATVIMSHPLTPMNIY